MSNLKTGNVHMHPSVSRYTKDKLLREADKHGMGLGEYLDFVAISLDSTVIEKRIVASKERFADTKEGRLEYLAKCIENSIISADFTPHSYSIRVMPPEGLLPSEIDVFLADLHYTGTDEDNTHLNKIFTDMYNEYVGDMRPLTLNLLGDMVDGTLRVSDLRRGGMNAVEQAVALATELIKHLQNFTVAKINYVFGNHSEMRIFKESHSQDVDNVEYIIATILSQAGYNVEYNGIIKTDRYILTHGHLFKSVKAMVDAIGDKNIPIFYGHFHTHDVSEFPNGVAYRVPTCRKSLSEYEISIGASSHTARYTVLLEDDFRKEVSL